MSNPQPGILGENRKSPAWGAWVVLVLAVASPIPARAATDLVSLTGSRFPDRAWAPVTAADAALAGAGRAADAASGWSVNPALLTQVGKGWTRATGNFLDPNRNDVQSTSIKYSDTSPHFTFGEAGAASSRGPIAGGLYFVQDAYDKVREAFIAGSPPVSRHNEFTSSLQRAGAGAAYALGRGASFGLALEVSRPLESLSSVPSEEAQGLGVPEARVELDGLSLGGAAGVFVRPEDWLGLGASARLAGETDLENEAGDKIGRDEVPLAVNLGVHVGRGSSGNLHLAASYSGPREVALGDSVGRGGERSPERVRLAAGYAYQSRAVPWEFRVGLGWSPYPGEGAARFTSFGVGLGYNLEGSLVRLSYAREARRTPEGETAARNFVVAGLDVRF